MKKKQSILFFTDKYPYSTGEPFIKSELEYLAQSFNVAILPFEKGNSSSIREVPDQVEIRIPIFNSAKNKKELLAKGLLNLSPILPFLFEYIQQRNWNSITKSKNWFLHLLFVRTLIAYCRKNNLIDDFQKYDQLYFYWGVRWSFILPFLPKKMHPKLLVKFHRTDLYEDLHSDYKPFRKALLQRLDLAIFISENGQEYLNAKYPFLKEKSIVSRLGTADYGQNVQPNYGKFHIFSCSILSPVKRVHLIAKSLMLIKEPIRWTHIGDGKEMKQLQGLIKKLSDNIDVELKGRLENDKVMNYMKTEPIDLFINVSSSEGVPVSIMEALSFGIPVIATNVGGTSEIVDRHVGILMESELEPSQLANYIKQVFYSKNQLQMRQKARERWFERCNAEKLYPEFIEKLQHENI